MNLLQRPSVVPIVRFDTSALDPTDQYDAWQANIGVFFDLAPPGDLSQNLTIEASINACNLGSTVLGVTRSQAQLFKRSTRRIAADNMDHILVQVFLEGGGTTRSNVTIDAGDMLIIDMSQEHCMLNTDFANLTLVLPRNLNGRLSDMLASLHGEKLSPRNPMVKLMAAHMRALWDSVPEMNIQEASAAVEGTQGLLESWLSQSSRLADELSGNVSIALGKSIRRYVEGHLAEPLTPESLVSTFRISRSQLYRIFAHHGGVARYLWERRLIRSMRMLANPMYLDLQVSTIAYRCGFSSEAHFSRVFKVRFSMTPTVVRRELMAAMAAEKVPEEATMLRERFPVWIRELQDLA